MQGLLGAPTSEYGVRDKEWTLDKTATWGWVGIGGLSALLHVNHTTCYAPYCSL